MKETRGKYPIKYATSISWREARKRKKLAADVNGVKFELVQDSETNYSPMPGLIMVRLTVDNEQSLKKFASLAFPSQKSGSKKK